MKIVLLDSTPLGVITNPKFPPETIVMQAWAYDMTEAGHLLIVPAIADYEVRRELTRTNSKRGLATLDAWNNAVEDRYLPLTDSALKLAAALWANSRNTGHPIGDPHELNADCILAAQALDFKNPLD